MRPVRIKTSFLKDLLRKFFSEEDLQAKPEISRIIELAGKLTDAELFNLATIFLRDICIRNKARYRLVIMDDKRRRRR